MLLLKILDKKDYSYKCKYKFIAQGDDIKSDVDFKPESISIKFSINEESLFILPHEARKCKSDTFKTRKYSKNWTYRCTLNNLTTRPESSNDW